MNLQSFRRPSKAQVQTTRGTMAVSATNERRAVYEEIKRLEKGNPNAYITDGFLRLEAVLASGANNTLSAINFQVLTNSGGQQRSSETRLNPSDAFYIERVGWYFGWQEKPNILPTQAQLETFPNGAVFGANNVPPLRGTLSGQLSVKVNSVEYIRQLDLLGLAYASTAQAGVLSAVGSAYEGSAADIDCSLYRLTPTVRLNGGSTNEIRVQMGDPQTYECTEDQTLVAVLYLKGWLAQNCGRFNPLQQG